MRVYYGIDGKYQDVTDVAVEKCLTKGILKISKTEFDRLFQVLLNILKSETRFTLTNK